MRKTPDLLGKNIPLVEAAHHGKRQRPTAILIRTSWTTDDSGAALGIAQAWHNPYNRVDSCHYVVDESKTFRCIPDKISAFPTKEFYKGAISINVCYDPPVPPIFSTVQHAAQLTARLCKLYRIPVHILTETEEERWTRHRWKHRGGIILKTVDGFPTEKFFGYVEDAYENF